MPPVSSLKPYIAIGVIVACTSLGAYLAWNYQAATYGKKLSDQETNHLLEIGKIRDAGVVAALKAQAQYDQLSSVLHDQAAQQYEENLRVNKENQDRITQLRSDSNYRVSVAVTSCRARSSGGQETSKASGVVHGPATAELDPAVAADLGAIAKDGDEAIRKLTACQGYVNELQQ